VSEGRNNLRSIGIAASLGSAASWAAGALLFNRIAERMDAMAMTLAKSAASIVLLGLALVIVESRRGGGETLFARLRKTDGRSLGLLALSGILGISVADTFFFRALHLLSPLSVVLLMMIGFVLTPMLAMIFLKEESSLARWLGIALVIQGIGVVMASNPGDEAGAVRLEGVVYGVLSVVSMSVSYVVAKKALESLTALQGTVVRMTVGSIGVFVVGLIGGRLGDWIGPLRDPGFLLFFLAAVAVVTFGGFWLTLVAIKNVDLSIANTLMATEPLFVLLIGAILFGEPLTLLAALGTVVALEGAAVLIVRAAPVAARVAAVPDNKAPQDADR
jgi:drug/metabolite transporter (DMT)-like permease